MHLEALPTQCSSRCDQGICLYLTFERWISFCVCRRRSWISTGCFTFPRQIITENEIMKGFILAGLFVWTALSAVHGFTTEVLPMSRQDLSSRRMVSISNDPASMFSLTPPSKYPTARGSEVDSRKIIAIGAGRQALTAVRLAHVLFASDELAQASLHEVQTGSITFEDLANQISLCTGRKGAP